MKPPPDLPIREGEIIAGKYRVERVIGAGGMGIVVAAEHIQLRQRVAIKFLVADGAARAETVARFMREAQAASRVQSEHVARVLDVAMLPNHTPYIVLEFLEGRDLAQTLAARGPLPLEEAVGFILQACEGVAEAHAAGIIHRDLKPSNLYVCDRGAGRSRVKVLDFGISKSLPGSGGESQLDLTATHAVLGSPLYMSPEQMSSSKHVDVRTDVWSLGVTLFELVCATTPFVGESITEVVTKVLSEPPRPVADHRPDLPPAFSAALSRALEKDRTRRYASVAQFARAMAAFGPRQAVADVERICDVPAAIALSPESAIMQPAPSPLAADPNAASWASAATGVAQDSSAAPLSASTAGARRAARDGARGGRPLLAVVAAVLAAASVAGAMAMRRAGSPGVPSRSDPRGSAVPIAMPASGAGLEPSPSLVLAPSAPSAPPGAAGASLATEPSLPTGRPASVSAAPAPHASGTARTRPPGPPHPQPQAMTGAATPALPSATAAAQPPAPPVCHVDQYVDSQGDVRFKEVCP